MSQTIPEARAPLLTLPGFPPDAVPFAVRSIIALLLAYLIAFSAQVEAASTAGVCVAIVAQPAAGMAMSKAIYRIIGTLVGGCVALALLAAFPQDRTLLLTGFAVWLGICTFVAVLLRDFRSYGAALSGYTAGIIAIGVIDAPGTALVATLDRVAAILIGVACVLVVNSLLAGSGAFGPLVQQLGDSTASVSGLAASALEGGPIGNDAALVQVATGVVSLQTQATYAALERPDGRARAGGARHAIAALLAMLSASRSLARAMHDGAQGPAPSPDIRAHLRAVASVLRGADDAPALAPPIAPPVAPRTPTDALLLQRANELLEAHRAAMAGLRVLSEGGDPLPRISLLTSPDVAGALLSSVRTLIALAFCATFCVLAGWSGATLLLIQLSAFVTLFATFPNPTQASIGFGVSLPVMAVIVGVANYLILPSVSGFVPFSLVVAPMVFATVLASRRASLAPYTAAAFLYLALLLGPANPENFDLGTYLDTVAELAIATLFTTLAFAVVLRVSPSRRLYRVARRIGVDLGRAMRGEGRSLDRAQADSLLYDRLMQATVWLGTPTRARMRLLGHLYDMGQLDAAMEQTQRALAAVASDPGLRAAAGEASAGLARGDAGAVTRAAEALLGMEAGPAQRDALLAAVAGLAETARLLAPDTACVRFYRKLMA